MFRDRGAVREPPDRFKAGARLADFDGCRGVRFLRMSSVAGIVGLGVWMLCATGTHRPGTLLFAPTIAAATPVAGSPGGTELSGRIEILDKDKKRWPGANSVVWIPGIAHSGTAPAAAATAASMASQEKHFAPHVLAVAAGTDVSFPNHDPIFHNVFSLTPENTFDLGLYRKGAAKSVRMGAPALVRIYCNIHSDMAAFVMVLDRAAFTVTDADGSYRLSLSALPAGTHSVYAWNERTGEQAQQITIGPAGSGSASASASTSAAAPTGSALKLDFLLDASAYRAQGHKNKYGREYPPVSKDVDRY
jgi:plastocyanin